jgi:hypothetical protein
MTAASNFTRPLPERLNGDIKQRTDVGSIFLQQGRAIYAGLARARVPLIRLDFWVWLTAHERCGWRESKLRHFKDTSYPSAKFNSLLGLACMPQRTYECEQATVDNQQRTSDYCRTDDLMWENRFVEEERA